MPVGNVVPAMCCTFLRWPVPINFKKRILIVQYNRKKVFSFSSNGQNVSWKIRRGSMYVHIHIPNFLFISFFTKFPLFSIWRLKRNSFSLNYFILFQESLLIPIKAQFLNSPWDSFELYIHMYVYIVHYTSMFIYKFPFPNSCGT